MMSIESLFHNLITSGTEQSDPNTLGKTKFLNIIHLVFIGVSPIAGLYYYFCVGAVFLFYVTVLAGLLMASSMVLLRKTMNRLLAGNYAILIIWATLLVLSWYTGALTHEGVIKPMWVLNVALVLLAILFNGTLWGWIWASLIIVETIVLAILFGIGYVFPDVIPPERSAAYFLGTSMICLFATIAVVFLYEKHRNEDLTREQEKSFVLRESKRYMDDILKRSPIPTFIMDKNHRVVQWNRACQEVTGIKSEDIIGKAVWEGFSVDNQGTPADILLEAPDSIEHKFGHSAKRESGWFELETYLPRLNGGQRAIITVAPITDKNGAVRGAIQTVQGIKGSHRGDGDLGNDLLHETAELLASPIFRVDSKGKISYWNGACEEHFGYSTSQVLGKSPLFLISKRYRPAFKETIIGVLKGGSSEEREWKYLNRKGQPVYVLARAKPLDGPDGKGKECVIINTDITDLKKKLRRLQHNAIETKEKLKSISEEYDLLKKNIATFIRKKDE